MAGDSERFYELPKERRLRLRALASELLDTDLEFLSAAQRITREAQGFVYLITNPAWPGLVKIGKACNPASRVAALNTADPFRRFTVEYRHFFDDARRVEAELHDRCAALRVEGEWFRMTVPEAKAELYRIWEQT